MQVDLLISNFLPQIFIVTESFGSYCPWIDAVEIALLFLSYLKKWDLLFSFTLA